MSGLTNYVSVIAPKYQLPQQLVQAICRVESGGDRFALRHEPAYVYLWDVTRNVPLRVDAVAAAQRMPPHSFPAPTGISRLTEWLGQQSSWGYMQVMGAVARELGFKGHLPGLCDPLEGLNYGCRHLQRLAERYLSQHGWAGVVAAYNAGAPRPGAAGFANQVYVDKVAAQGGLKGLV